MQPPPLPQNMRSLPRYPTHLISVATQYLNSSIPTASIPILDPPSSPFLAVEITGSILRDEARCRTATWPHLSPSLCRFCIHLSLSHRQWPLSHHSLLPFSATCLRATSAGPLHRLQQLHQSLQSLTALLPRLQTLKVVLALLQPLGQRANPNVPNPTPPRHAWNVAGERSLASSVSRTLTSAKDAARRSSTVPCLGSWSVATRGEGAPHSIRPRTSRDRLPPCRRHTVRAAELEICILYAEKRVGDYTQLGARELCNPALAPDFVHSGTPTPDI